jgi:hypothetical protein
VRFFSSSCYYYAKYLGGSRRREPYHGSDSDSESESRQPPAAPFPDWKRGVPIKSGNGEFPIQPETEIGVPPPRAADRGFCGLESTIQGPILAAEYTPTRSQLRLMPVLVRRRQSHSEFQHYGTGSMLPFSCPEQGP